MKEERPIASLTQGELMAELLEAYARAQHLREEAARMETRAMELARLALGEVVGWMTPSEIRKVVTRMEGTSGHLKKVR